MSECTREEGTNGMGSDAGEGENECRVGSACGTPSATEGGACPLDIECDGDGDKSFKDMKNKNMSSSGNMRHEELQGPVLSEQNERGLGNELETEADENQPATLKSKRTKKRKTKTAGADKAKSGPSKSFLQKELQRATEDNMRMMKLLKSKSKLVAQKKAEVDALMEQNETLERRVNEMERAQEGGRQREEHLGERCSELEKKSCALAEKLKESEKRADEERKVRNPLPRSHSIDPPELNLSLSIYLCRSIRPFPPDHIPSSCNRFSFFSSSFLTFSLNLSLSFSNASGFGGGWGYIYLYL